MSSRRAILLLLAGIALLAAAHFAVDCSQKDSAAVRRRTAISPAADSAVRFTIRRRDGGRPVALALRDGVWRIEMPFAGLADEGAVKRLSDALAFAPASGALADAELLKRGRDRADFSLDRPAVTVEVEGKDGETETVSFGDTTPEGNAVYAAVSGVDAVFAVPASVLAAADVYADGFRRRSLFPAGMNAPVAFDVKRGTASASAFTLDGAEWRSPGSAVSQAKVKEYLDALLRAEAAGFAWPVGSTNENPEASASLLAGYGLEPDAAVTVTLKGRDGATAQLSFGKAAGDGFVYALAQGGSAVVTVPAALKDPAAAETALFEDSRIFQSEPRNVAAFTVADGATSYALVRGEAGSWRLESPISAPADAAAAEAMLARILALSPADADENGVAVAVAADAVPAKVSRRSVLGGARFEDLRSREVVKIDPSIAKRIVRTREGKSVAVAYSREGRSWRVETEGADAAEADGEAAAAILAALNPLEAVRVENMKVSASDLSSYGLDTPYLTLAVDQDSEDAVRRNLMIGAEAGGGRFATVGSSDAVFLLSAETVKTLSRPVARGSAAAPQPVQ